MFPSGIDPQPQASCPAPGCGEYPTWRDEVIEDIRFEDLADAFELLVYLESPDDYDDAFELVSADGSYSQTLTIPEGERQPGLVVIYFREITPDTTWTLTHLPGDGRRIPLFDGASSEELLAPLPEAPVYDPPDEPGEEPELEWTSGNEDFRWTDELALPFWKQSGASA